MPAQPRANQAAIVTPFSAQPHFAEFAAQVAQKFRELPGERFCKLTAPPFLF